MKKIQQGDWVKYGTYHDSGEPVYWNVFKVFDNDVILAQRYQDDKIEYREISPRQYAIVQDKELCRKLTREFVGT